MAGLGVYEPAAFMEEAPMMFYALEEDLGYKVPVVFVHGINGSARDFAPIIAGLDRRIYKPWFFHYPSGYDLGQLSEMFYSIFLSGKVISLGDTPLIIVAYSMGGLVVRDALSRCTGATKEAKTKLLITIASPMGGHPDAKAGASAPVVIPSWRNLAPDSDFMQRMYRRELPDELEYHLLYAYVKLGHNSDGVVPLASQLDSRAQKEAAAQYGFNDSHEGILKNGDAIAHVIELMGEVKSLFPDDHLKVLGQGGYNVELGKGYSILEKYYIRTYGRYMDALASGAIVPFHPTLVQFLRASQGEKSPDDEFESSWCKFIKDFPDRSQLQ
jgi:pimeloyl-ACP methyl ester carboxylesterase